ncbi:hypothetical protein HTV45_19340 [Streptomyces sp. CHD11]|uniref:2Fe-2S iron-sulfur cluster-binding protein n=1 Tax=Streptomyces sp. CHD11 TaxID=2741325 RepID=UPI001BFC2880|nr:2Fe-2S iron-sulfur cluster-binding protein [Streptomyces sp. CHD11]MBT3152998.1 hypothetical protein [Streptomyces sp. CHD11]
MTDDQHGEGRPPGGSRWDPLPQGDYDDGATAFVNLPEGGIDALLDSMESPLAAPGHGYVPPQITVAPATAAGTDPAATGSWAVPGAPVDGAQWHDPQAGEPDTAGGDRFAYRPGATGQWHFEENRGENRGDNPGENPAPGQDVTGQWSIPVAGGDLPDESGEFTTSALADQWGGTPPPTLPGGAQAPWAATQAIGRPWGPGVPGVPQDDGQQDGGRQDGGHGSAGERQETAPRPHDGPGRAGDHTSRAPSGHDAHPREDHAPQAPAGPDGYGGAPAHDGPEHPGHPGHRSAGVPQPMPAGGHEEPQWRSGAPAADGAAPAGLREHPHDAARNAGRPLAAGEAPEAPEGARTDHTEHTDHTDHEDHAGGPAGPRTARPGAAPDSGAAPGASPAFPPPGDREDPGVPDAGSPAPDTEPETPDAGPGAAATAPDEPSAAPGEPVLLDAPHDDHPLASYVLRVNGTDRPVTDAWIGESLLYVLRERLGLAGAKDGCSQGECGACNVQVDGRLVASCLVPAVTAAGSEVRTVEGLAQDGRPSDVQRALARCGAVQCGFCVPGMAMTVHDLLEGNPAPTELETRQALCGNLCRCSGYRGVVDAVQEVVGERRERATSAESGSDDEPDPPRIPHQAGPGAGGVNPTAFGGPGPREQSHGRPHDQSYGQDGGQA